VWADVLPTAMGAVPAVTDVDEDPVVGNLPEPSDHDTGPWLDAPEDPRWPSWVIHDHSVKAIEDVDTGGLL
jgi:hypothetical protein